MRRITRAECTEVPARSSELQISTPYLKLTCTTFDTVPATETLTFTAPLPARLCESDTFTWSSPIHVGAAPAKNGSSVWLPMVTVTSESTERLRMPVP